MSKVELPKTNMTQYVKGRVRKERKGKERKGKERKSVNIRQFALQVCECMCGFILVGDGEGC